MYVGVGEVSSKSWECIGCCVPYLGEQQWAIFLGFSICNQAGHSWFAYKKMFAPLPVHQLYRSAALPEQARRVAEKELKVGSC